MLIEKISISSLAFKKNNNNVNQKNITSPIKNDSDSFIHSHKTEICTIGSILVAIGAGIVAKKGNLGSKIKNFINNLFDRNSAKNIEIPDTNVQQNHIAKFEKQLTERKANFETLDESKFETFSDGKKLSFLDAKILYLKSKLSLDNVQTVENKMQIELKQSLEKEIAETQQLHENVLNKFIQENGEILDETIELLPGYTKKALNNDLSNLSPDNMVLVHATDYFPQNGIIKSAANARLESTGLLSERDTVHTSINHFVNSHLAGNWNDKKFTVIMPMDKIMSILPKENIIGGELIDFFVKGNLPLPSGSIIIKSGCKDIPQGKLRFTELPNSNGIKLLETPEKNIHDFTNSTIEKMGYTTIIKNNKGTLASITGGSGKYSQNKKKAWFDFTQKYGLERLRHNFSIYGDTEKIFWGLDALKIGNENKWIKEQIKEVMVLGSAGKTEKLTETINYKERLLELIDDIKQELQNGQQLNFDIDVVSKIIQKSKTPSEAITLIEEKLRIKANYFSEITNNDANTILNLHLPPKYRRDIEKQIAQDCLK